MWTEMVRTPGELFWAFFIYSRDFYGLSTPRESIISVTTVRDRTITENGHSGRQDSVNMDVRTDFLFTELWWDYPR